MGGHERPGSLLSVPAPELAAFIQRNGLALPGERGEWLPLTGGVSSDIWRVSTSKAVFCVKRALAKLRVAADWEADVGRNAFEWEYMKVAAAIVPGAVPTPIAQDAEHGLFAMAWLRPDDHKLWKSELLAGRADAGFACDVGDLLGRIHAATAADHSIPARFATDENFLALRLDPYLLTTARAHLDLSRRIEAIAAKTASTRLVLVHGDVSPKNILIGPDGPVLLDAEVAWFGDPAFDLAFCINHLVIKAGILPAAADSLLASFSAFAAAYLRRVDWEEPSGLEARAAALLPALALARVDGKSPVEYLTEAQRQTLRGRARAAIVADCRQLSDVFGWLTT